MILKNEDKIQNAKGLQEVTWDFRHIALDSLMEVKCLLTLRLAISRRHQEEPA